jgi:hypothetical protein
MIANSRLQLALLLSSLIGVTAFVSSACGGISDPTKGGEGRVATVSGALTGITVPANARVALVYRKIVTVGTSTTTTVQVGSDVPVVGGKFTMNIGVPADDLFGAVDGSSITSVSSSPPSVRTPSPTTLETPPSAGTGGSSTSGSAGAFGERLAPRDLVGGSITEPLTAALAGFVVYADTNGNGQLDLEGQYASSPDQILGGNKELMLVYLKGGGSLDYEKMRDKSGILPTAGFDLAWTEGRWLPLTDVELKLAANAQLPSAVCQTSSGGFDTVSASPDPTVSSGGGSAGAGGSSGTGGSGGVSTTSDGGSSGTYYPSPSDPQLKCSPDGRSYTYGDNPTTCTTPPAPTDLCAGDVYPTAYCAGSTGYGNALANGAPVPAGWPCPTPLDLDGGGAPDGSTFDGGSADGGSADGG